MVHKPYDAYLVYEYLHEVHDGEIAPTFVLCSSEAWFHLSGYVTSWNNRSPIQNPGLSWSNPNVCGTKKPKQR